MNAARGAAGGRRCAWGTVKLSPANFALASALKHDRASPALAGTDSE